MGEDKQFELDPTPKLEKEYKRSASKIRALHKKMGELKKGARDNTTSFDEYTDFKAKHKTLQKQKDQSEQSI